MNQFITIDGKNFDAKIENWFNQEDKKIAKISTSAMTSEMALDLFQRELPWSYTTEILNLPEGEEPQYEIVDMSNVNIFDHIEVYPSDDLVIFMRELSDLEQAYELLYGGE